MPRRLAPAVLTMLGLAACAGRGSSRSLYAGPHTWENCLGQRAVEVRNGGPAAVDVYASELSGGAVASTFVRQVDARSTVVIPAGPQTRGMSVRRSASEREGRRIDRQGQVAVRYICE